MTDYERGVRDMAKDAHDICTWIEGSREKRAHGEVDHRVDLLLERENNPRTGDFDDGCDTELD